MSDRCLTDAPTRIVLTATDDVRARFCLLTGDGFRIRVRLGCTVRELLSGPLGIAPGYLEERIQTILLNGQVVDDPAAATVPAGATLALSAAMPGIAGAMLRKASRLAVMRSPVSYQARGLPSEPAAEGEVVIKLFNVLQRELGPALLCRGIRIPGATLHKLFRGRRAAFRAGLVAAEVAGEPVAPDVLLDTDWTSQEVLLVVRPQTP